MAWTVRPRWLATSGTGSPSRYRRVSAARWWLPSPAEHLLGVGGVDPCVPRVVALVGRLVLDLAELALLAGLASPVVGQLVAGHADEPGDGQLGHRCRARWR